MFPLPVFLAKIPSPVAPVTAPRTSMVRFPVPAFSALIPLAEPVTALAVMVIDVATATVFLANIP